VPERYKRNPNIKCAICAKPIYRRPSEIEKSKGHITCSSICYGQTCRKERPCMVCGKLILAHYHKKTCSRGCANTHRAGIRYKMGSPHDKVKSQQALKLKLLRVRGKNCERCGYNKFEILQVHHKDRNRNNNSLDNLALICPNCHCEEHLLEKSWLKNFDEVEAARATRISRKN